MLMHTTVAKKCLSSKKIAKPKFHSLLNSQRHQKGMLAQTDFPMAEKNYSDAKMLSIAAPTEKKTIHILYPVGR